MSSQSKGGGGKPSFIAAIDFGTSYSGYVFAVQSHMELIHSVYWGMEHGLKTAKTPTCILFNEQQQFSQFGYDAVMKYHTMPSSDAQKWFYFSNFKMELYSKKKLTPEITLTATNGKTMSALKVFTESIRFMKNHALGAIAAAAAAKFDAADVTWVLTVPAIWDIAAKQFMRLAALEAGLIKDIQSTKLVIALEAEAAAIWCKQLPRKGFMAEGGEQNLFQDSFKIRYIVVDCGGGTVDMTVHEIQQNKSLKELHKASGGGWGGSTVDRNFAACLKEIFHSGVWDEYTREYPEEMEQMMYSFGLQKCSNNKGNVVIRCYCSLIKVAEKQRPIAQYFDNKEGLSWSEGCIVITHEKMKSFYGDCLSNIIKSMQEIFKKGLIKKVKYILLVGGFASSVILRDAVCAEFGKSHVILCPLDSQAAIAKGALVFGNNPRIIGQRICARTYGVSVVDPFRTSIHDVSKKRSAKDGVYCADVFMKLVGTGEAVDVDQNATYTFFPINDNDEHMRLDFYATEKENALYTDEDGVEKIGSIVVSMPNRKLGIWRQVRLNLQFGLTEIKATATDLSSNEARTVLLDFLTK